MRWSARRWRSPRTARRPPGTRFAASCTGRTSRSSSSTPLACTGRARCWGSGSTTWLRTPIREVDVIGLCIRPTRRSARGTGGSTSRSATIAPNTTLVVVVTKIDKVPRERVAAQLLAVSELLGPDTEIVPAWRPGATIRRLDRRAGRPVAARPGVLPRRRAHRRAGRRADGGAHPRGRAGRRARRAAALAGRRIDEVSPREGRDDLIDVHASSTSNATARRASSSARARKAA